MGIDPDSPRGDHLPNSALLWYEMLMNDAETSTAHKIEQTLSGHGSYRKVEDNLYVIKQGSTYVMINVVPWGPNRAIVRCVAQLVKGVPLTQELATQLMALNARLRFGAFAYEPEQRLLLFTHSLLGGTTLDADELLAALTDMALIADEYDDKIIAKYGGQTMRDLLEQSAFERILVATPQSFFDFKR
jgi:hypothetical protein